MGRWLNTGLLRRHAVRLPNRIRLTGNRRWPTMWRKGAPVSGRYWLGGRRSGHVGALRRVPASRPRDCYA